MSKKSFKSDDLNGMLIYIVERITELENDVKWIKRILYILLALIGSIIGLKIV